MDQSSKLLTTILLTIWVLRRCAALAGNGNGVLRPTKGGSGVGNIIDFCLNNPEECGRSLSKRDESSLRLFLAYLKKRHEFESGIESNTISSGLERNGKHSSEIEMASSGPGHEQSAGNRVETSAGRQVETSAGNRVESEESSIDSQNSVRSSDLLNKRQKLKGELEPPTRRPGPVSGVSEKQAEVEARLSIVIKTVEDIVESLLRKPSVRSDLENLLEQVEEEKERPSGRDPQKRDS